MPHELRTREFVLDRAQVDKSLRTVAASLSSESPVRRGGEIEVLRHSTDAVDLTRAAGGLPLLFSHDRTAPIGVVDGVRIDAGRLVGQLRFGQSAKATEVFNDVLDGVLRNVSISYSVDATEAIEGGYAVTRWAVYEASVVSVPADPTVGIGRSAQDLNHPGANTMPQNNTQTRDAENTEIRALVKRHKLPDEIAEQLITQNATPDVVQRRVLDLLAVRDELSGGHINVSNYGQRGNHGTSVPGALEQRDQVIEALAFRMGGAAVQGENPYLHASLSEIARECLEVRGVRTTGMSRSELISRSIEGGHTASDFPNLLTTSGARTLRQSFNSYAGGLKRICKPSTAIDFRAKQRLMLGEAPALLKTTEGGEFKSGTMAEMKSSYALSTFGRIFSISRQALINDDLNAFGELSVKYGRAAAEFESSFLVTLLTSNPVMSDSLALFHATHGNLQTGAPSALSVTSLSTARQAMRLQKGLDGSTPIDATPKYLVVPAALETTAEQLLTQIMATQISNVNPFGGKLEMVVDPRLDVLSATAWYLAADANLLDTVEYSYLDSANGPELESERGFEVDGMQWKVRLDFGAGVLDWRGLYKSNGV